MTISKKILMLASCAAIALAAACSPGHDNGRVAGQLTPQPVVPGATPIPIAGARGIQNDIYFNDELSQARAKVEGMRTEMAALSAKLAGLQDKIKTLVADMPPVPAGLAPLPADANVVTTTKTEIVPATTTLAEVAQAMETTPVSTPMSDGPIAVSPVEMTTPVVAETTTVTTTTEATKAPAAAPTQITGQMGTPVPEAKGMKPIVAGTKKTQVKTETKTEIKTDAKLATAGKDGVNAVRFGTHGETVRVVLDVTGSAEGAKPELDNAEHIMTITLPKTKWAGTATESVAKNPLVASYSAQPAGDGSVVAFVLKGDTKIVSSSVLKNPTRVVVDLAK